MPKYFLPSKSGVHRHACLTLYKALLRTTLHLKLPHGSENGLQSLIRARFQAQKALQSPSQIITALKAGYEALDLLHDASENSPDAYSRLSALLDATAQKHLDTHKRAIERAASAPPLSKNQLAKAVRRAANADVATHPNTTPILSRPLPLHKLTGRRHVPTLVNASGFPFLRIKKPQPPALSRTIRWKLGKRVKWQQMLMRLELAERVAEGEDKWDKEVAGLDEGLRETDETLWVDVVVAMKQDIFAKIEVWQRKASEMAEKLARVVEKEREFFERERNARRARRREAISMPNIREAMGRHSERGAKLDCDEDEKVVRHDLISEDEGELSVQDRAQKRPTTPAQSQTIENAKSHRGEAEDAVPYSPLRERYES